MSSLQYINSKLSDAIYILTVHEGDARRRLMEAYPKLKILNPKSFPSGLAKDYSWVLETIERGRTKAKIEGVREIFLPHIHNSTASKVIAKIVKIQYEVDMLFNQELNV